MIENQQLAAKLLNDQIDQNIYKRTMMKQYLDYYRGDHRILDKPDTGDGKPNNKLVFNFCSLIVDVTHSFLFSKPYSMDVKNKTNFIQKILKRSEAEVESFTEEFMDELKAIYWEVNEENITSNHGKIATIMGSSTEILYIDKEGEIRFEQVDPREFCFFIYDGVEYALRSYTTYQYVPTANNKDYIKEEKEKAELYSAESVAFFEKGARDWELIDVIPHSFGEVPVIQYLNKDVVTDQESTSDLKDMVILNDSYNNVMSSLINTLEYSGDPYLLFTNALVDESTAASIKESRIIQIDGDGAAVNFLEWNQNINAYTSALETIERLSFVLSETPDLFGKEGLSSDSGVSLRLKFTGAELKGQQKERAFIKGLRKRIRLLARQLELKTGKPYYSSKVYQNIDLHFSKNLPTNLKELSEVIKNFSGQLSEESKLKLLPFIPNAKEEVEKMKEEGNSMSSMFGVTDNGTNN